MVDPGYITVFLNGVLVQDHTPLEGPTGHMGRSRPRPFPEKGPLALQDHGNPTRFRNIWYRSLPPRASEGGTDGLLTSEAAKAKRSQIAATIRADAASLRNASNPVPEMLRWFESLVYEEDAAALKQATEMADSYLKAVKALPAAQLAGKRDEARQFRDALKYLVKFKRIPDSFAPLVDLEQLIKDQGWDRRRP